MRARAVRPSDLGPEHASDQMSIFRMIATIAGPYGKNYSQGKVGGVLAELGFKAGQVWKL